MTVTYDKSRDLLYVRLSEASHQVVNRRLGEEVVLDLGADDQIVGIEILDASKHVPLGSFLTIDYQEVA